MSSWPTSSRSSSVPYVSNMKPPSVDLVLPGKRPGEPGVQVVVMVPKNLDDLARTAEPRVRANVDGHGPGGDEAVDEVLAEAPVDLGSTLGRTLATAASRCVARPPVRSAAAGWRQERGAGLGPR